MLRHPLLQTICAGLALGIALSLAMPASARVFSSGVLKLEAEVVAYDGKRVTLKTEFGVLPMDVAKLDAADQDFLKKTYPNGKVDESKEKEKKKPAKKEEPPADPMPAADPTPAAPPAADAPSEAPAEEMPAEEPEAKPTQDVGKSIRDALKANAATSKSGAKATNSTTAKSATAKSATAKAATESKAGTKSSTAKSGTAKSTAGKVGAAKSTATKSTKGDVRVARAESSKSGTKASGKPQIDVQSLVINKPSKTTAKSDDGPNFNFIPAGTYIKLRVTGGGDLVGLDDKSKFTECTDDVGTDLTKSTGRKDFFGGGKLMMHVDELGGLVDVNQPQIPGAGATKISLKGTLHVIVGSGEKTDEVPQFSLANGTPIAGAPVDLTVETVQKLGVGKSKMIVTLQSASPLSNIKKFTFLNAAGEEIASQPMGGGSFGFGNKQTHQKMVGLAEVVDAAALRIISYEKTETIAVPVDLEFGLGL